MRDCRHGYQHQQPLNQVTWTYDAAGRMASRTADNTTTTYTYDANGNRLTASAGGLVITATYDRLNRVLTVDDEDAGTTADTSYTYSLTSPSWTDPTGTYTATLDKFDRATALHDPFIVSNRTPVWSRREKQPDASGARRYRPHCRCRRSRMTLALG